MWIWRKDWGVGFLAGYLFLILVETILIRSPGELRYELVPFWSWRKVFAKWPLKYSGRIMLQQILLNIAMFIPIGTILGWKNGWKTILIAVGISAAIEFIQLVTHRGLFEFNDIIHNTLGAVIGFGISMGLRKVKKNDF